MVDIEFDDAFAETGLPHAICCTPSKRSAFTPAAG
jgi:hypothetical protein